MPDMNAIVVEEYGGIEKLVARKMPKPENPEGYDILVQYVFDCAGPS